MPLEKDSAGFNLRKKLATYVGQDVVGAAVVGEGEDGHGVHGLDQVEHDGDHDEGQGRELPGRLGDEPDGVEAGADWCVCVWGGGIIRMMMARV